MTTRKPGVEEDHAPFKDDEGETAATSLTHKARPVEGGIDFRAMRTRLAARFPKTLAKLAE
jgi:hypothetical protein